MTTTTVRSPDALLSLRDIAALAHVQRPVVSMWRSRKSSTDKPFPAPAVRSDSRDLFDMEQIVAWLEQTGLGNNADIRQDAALFTALDASGDGEAALGILTSLLVLAHVSQRSIDQLDQFALLDLADEVDPEDEFVYRELVEAGEELTAWAAHGAAVVTSAYTCQRAFEFLFALTVRLGVSAVVASKFESWATSLVARVVAEVGPFETVVAPAGEVASVIELAAGFDGDLPPLLAPPTTSPSTRLQRRRAFLAGWRPMAPNGAGRFKSGPAAVVAQYPNVAEQALGDEEVLDKLSEISLSLRPGDFAVVLAPASVLVAPLRGERLLLRADILRTGKVRAIVHLPAGLWPARTRQRLALWVLGDAHVAVPPHRRWITVADLEGIVLEEAAVADLVSDIVTALGDEQSVRGHAFRFARVVPASSLLATDGILVPPRARLQLRPREGAVDSVLRLTELADRATAAPQLINFNAEPSEASGGQVVSLGELIAAKQVRVLPGRRFRQEDIDSGQGMPLIGRSEVLDGRLSERGIDRLVLATSYPMFRYTEPGDVVFYVSPQLGAFVDVDGFSAVETPVRVLRLASGAPGQLHPEILAAALSCAPDGTPWRAVRVPVLPTEAAAALAQVLAQVDSAQLAAAERLEALGELRSALMAAVPAGAVRLTVSSSCADDFS